MAPRAGVVVFPGTNCEHDVVAAFDAPGRRGRAGVARRQDADGFRRVVLPGGFAHGDYLRPGASPGSHRSWSAVADFADAGGPVVGICNGFQVLTEARLLPGALQKNKGLRFCASGRSSKVASDRSVLTAGVEVGRRLRIPINHFEGNYACDPDAPANWSEGRVVLRYIDNPNGSADDIAGVATGRQCGRPHAPP